MINIFWKVNYLFQLELTLEEPFVWISVGALLTYYIYKKLLNPSQTQKSNKSK